MSLLLPALHYAERDRLEGRLSPDEETAVVEATRDRDLLWDAAEAMRRLLAALQASGGETSSQTR